MSGQKISQGNIFGRIGSSIGAGLAEQIPKEAERYRLKEGLSQLEKDAPGLSNFSQFSRFASTPGVTPAMLQAGAPLLQQDAIRRESKQNQRNEQVYKNPTPSDEAKPSNYNKNNKEEYASAQGQDYVQSPRSTQVQLELIQPRSNEEKKNEAIRLSNENPRTYPTWLDAMPFVESQDKNRLDRKQAELDLSNREDALANDIDKGIKKEISEKNVNNLDSTIWNKLNEKAEEDVRTGKMGKKDAIKAQGKIAKKLDNNFIYVDEAAKKSFYDTSKDKMLTVLNNGQRAFKEADSLPEYSDILQDKAKLSNAYANYIAFPPKDNKNVNNYSAKLKPNQHPFNELMNPDISDEEVKELADKSRNRHIEVARDLAKMIGQDKNSSPSAIALSLKTKNFEPQQLMEEFQRLNEKDPDLFNEWQKQDISKGISFFPSLNDMYLYFMTGLDPIVEEE